MTSILHDEPQEAVPTPHVDGEPQGVIRMLHVEDESDQRVMVKLFLERNDPALHVESAASPDEALHMLESQVFSCVVSDYVMPGMNGIEFARRVRETSMIPFILYTGQGSEEVASAAFAAGVDDYLRKEIDPSHYEVLAKRVRSAVEKNQAEEAERKRTKEISCLYGISRLVMSGLDLEGIIGGIVTLISPAWHYPGKTCARITLEGRSFEMDNYRKTSHELSADIKVRDENVGTIEIGYLGERSEGLGSPFLVEERDLINAISERLGGIIERKRAEDDLQESEERARALLNASIEVMLLIDSEGIILATNKTLGENLGKDTGEIIGKCLYDLLPPKIAEFRKAKADKVLSTGKPIRFEERREGRTYDTQYYPVSDADGKVTAVALYARDITMRKQYEERLNALHFHAAELGVVKTVDEVAESTLTTIEGVLGFNLGSFGVVEDDLLRHILIRGFETEEVLEMPLDGPGVTVRAVRTGETQLIPDIRDDESYVIGLSEGLYETLSELAIPVKIGEEVVAVINLESTRLSAFTDRDRRLLEIFAEHVASAISRLRHVEMLRASEERFRGIAERSNDMICIVDMTGRFSYVSPAVERIFGYSAEEITGKFFHEFLPESDRPRVAQSFIEAIKVGEVEFMYPLEVPRRDGSQAYIEANMAPITRDGEMVGFQGVLRDITERKQMEEELIQYSETLEDMVEQRTKELETSEKELFFRNVLLEAVAETTPDGILVVDREGKTILFNKRFGEMWNIPQEILDTRSHEPLVQSALGIVRDPEAFLEKVEYLYDHEDEKSYDEIEFLDGTVFDRYSSPLLDPNGVYLGRIWFCRDITRRKQAEVRARQMKEALKKAAENLEDIVDDKTRELRVSEERWRTLLEASMDAPLAEKKGE